MKINTGSKSVVVNAWSDEARQASAEARKGGGSGSEAQESKTYLAGRMNDAGGIGREAAEQHTQAAQIHQELSKQSQGESAGKHRAAAELHNKAASAINHAEDVRAKQGYGSASLMDRAKKAGFVARQASAHLATNPNKPSLQAVV
jgi:hypothetical protein